jgi:hypothetical protein
MTGKMPGPGGIPVVFFIPEGSGEPERIKNAAAPMMSIMPINPRTSTGDSTVFGRSGESMGSAGGDK